MTLPIGITLSLDGANQVEAGLKRVSGGMDTVGMSAKKTAAALRGVPAQFTDIVTSLQGGQAPLTVFLQQGGQLKDMFGGAGAAAKALGGYVLGLATPVNLAAASVAAIGYAMYQGAEQQRAFRQALILSGNAAGATAGQIEQVYAAVSKSTRQYGASEDVINALVRSRQVGLEQLQATASAVVQFSKVAGVDAKALVADFAAIGKDPVKAVQTLQEKYGILTAATYQQAAALAAQGKQQDAANLVMSRAAEDMDKIGQAAKENKGNLEAFWDAVKGMGGKVYQGVADWGKEETPEARLEVLKKQMEVRESRKGMMNDAFWIKGTEQLQSQIDKTQALVTANQELAKSQSDAVQVNEKATAGISLLNSAYDQHMGKQEQLIKKLRDLKEARDDALKAPGVDMAEVERKYAAGVSAANRQYAPSYDMASLMHSLLLQESNNRQFRDDGSVVRNASSGATGIAQIVPKYGPDYARMAGVEWSPELLESSADYGKKLAEAGIKTYLKMFDGDLEKALSAYNAGPGTVKKAMSAAGVDGDWKAAMAQFQSAGNFAETKNYREQILGRMPKDSQGDYASVLGAAPSSGFDKAVAEDRAKLAKATAEADAAQRGLTASQKEFEALQASPTWASYNNTQKETRTTLFQLMEVQERIKASADDGRKIKALADAQEAANSVFGKSKTVIEEMKLAQMGANLAQAEAAGRAPELIAQLKATANEQQRYVDGLKESDYKVMSAHSDELLRNAKELSRVYGDELSLTGLTALERAKVVAQRQVEIKYAKELADLDKQSTAEFKASDRYVAEVAKINQAKQIESSAVVAKVVQDDWVKTSEQINQSLTDALLRGFESGKGFAQNFADTVKNMFNTMVLRPVISAVMAPTSGVINGVVQQGLNAVGLGSSSNLMGMAQNASSLYNLGSTAAGWLGIGGSAAATGLGLTAIAGTGTTLAATGAGLGLTGGLGAGYGLAAGGSLGLSSAGFGTSLGSGIGTSAAVSGAAASGAGGLMSGVAAAAPWIAGGLALYSVLSSVFDHKSTGEYGGTGYYSAATGSATTTAGGAYGTGFGGLKGGNDQILSQMAGLSQTIVQSLDATAKSFGQKAGYEVATSFASDFGDDATWGGLKIALQGQSLVNWNDNRQTRWAPKEFASGEEGYKQYLNAVALDVKTALQGMDLPGWANQLVSAAGDLDSINAALQQIGTVKAVFDALGQSMQMFKGISGELQTQLLNAFGSVDALSSGVGAFYEGFYSEQERMTILSGNLRETLSGLDLSLDPAMGEAAKAQFKAAVEAAMAAGQGELAAKLLAMSGSFASTADYAQQIIEQMANDAAQAAQQAAEMAARNSAKESDLQIQLLRAQGRETEAVVLERQRELQAMAEFGPAAQALQQQIWAVTDAASSAVGGLSGSFSAFTSLAGAAAGHGDASALQDYLSMLTGSYGSALGIAGQQAILDAIARTEQALDSAGASASALERAAITARQTALQEELRTAQNLLRVASSLGEYVESLYAGEQSGLSDFERLSVLGGQYQSLLAAASAGDSDAMGKLQGVSGDYLKLAQQLSGSQADYSVLSGRIAAELGALSATSKASASAAETLAQQQIAVLDKQLSSLTAVSTTTQGLTQQLLQSAQQQFEQDLQNATQQLISTDSIAAGLAQLPPELAAILANSISGALNPALSAIASAVANGAKQSSIGALTGAVSTGKITVDLANKLAGGATGSTSGAYKNAIESTGMSEGQFYGLLANNAKPWISAGNGAGMAADMLEYGVSMTDAAKALGMSTGDVAAWLLEHGATKLPQLAVGTNYVPQDMLAQIHEGEAVVPKAFNPWANSSNSRNSNAELIAEIRALRAEINALKAPIQQTATAATEHKQMFENATAGGNAMAVEVMA